jgi:hypothetical protein
MNTNSFLVQNASQRFCKGLEFTNSLSKLRASTDPMQMILEDDPS